MAKDKFSAVWVSHSSIGDFLKCPRAYYLNNVYKDPKTGHKISLMAPPLALGQAVHEVVEALSVLPAQKRFDESLIDKFEVVWKKVAGKKGGFVNDTQEQAYKKRGKEMLKTVIDNPGPLNNLAVKISMDLPYYWLSEDDNIILCGKIDWLEYIKADDSVHVIDFKTGKRDEKDDSLQLPIYCLLVGHCQARPVSKVSYWYLDRASEPVEQTLPDLDEAEKRILKIAKNIKLARQLERYACPHGGCYACKPLEAIVSGKAEFVGVNDFRQDLYIVPEAGDEEAVTSEIL